MEHRAKLIIIPPIARTGERYEFARSPRCIRRRIFPIFADGGAHQLSIRGSRAARFLSANCPVSTKSDERETERERGRGRRKRREEEKKRRKNRGLDHPRAGHDENDDDEENDDVDDGDGGGVGRVRARLFTSMPFLSWRVPSVTRK